MRRSLLCISFAILCALTSAIVAAAQAQTSTQPSAPAASENAELPALRERLDRAESRLKDWPQLGRYRDANGKVSPPSKNETRVVFIGDSITDQWDDASKGGFFPGKPYHNRGIGGQTTPQMLIRLRPDVLALRPNVVVILAGTNDLAGNTGPTTLETIKDNLTSMTELARLHGIRVVLASLLPVSDYERRQNGEPITQTVRRPPTQITALNTWLREYATTNGHTYLDYHTALVDPKGMLRDELSDDGLHVNAAGYAIMAPLAETAINEALKKKPR